MNRRLHLPALCAALLFTLPASSCGPDFPFAVFLLPHGPGGNYLAYAQGHLGILQPGYRTRSLVIAFDYITHHPLSPAEQQQAVAADKQIVDPWQAEEVAKKSAPPSGFDTWISTRSALGPVDGYTPDAHLEVSRNLPGKEYESFSNCLDNAFATAANTLSTLSLSYGRTNVPIPPSLSGPAARMPSFPTVATANLPSSSAPANLPLRRPHRICPQSFQRACLSGCNRIGPTSSLLPTSMR
jgi:hypothetical protein